MERHAGDIVGEVALDALGFAEERVEDPELLVATMTLVVEDDDGVIHVITHSWPPKD